MQQTKINEHSAGWRLFWKSVVYTVAAVSLIAVGFFGAMAVSGMFV